MNVTQLLLFGYVDSSPTVVQLQLQVPLWWQGKQPGPKKLIKVAVELFPEQLVDVTWFTTFLAVETSLNLLWHPMSVFESPRAGGPNCESACEDGPANVT